MARNDPNDQGRKIEVIKHPNGTETPLYFNQRSMTFTVCVGPDKHRTQDGQEARAWANAMLGKSAVLKWVPVIETQVGEHHYFRGDRELKADFMVEAERFWLAKTPDKLILRLDWNKGDEDSAAYLESQDDKIDEASHFRFDGRERHGRNDPDLKPEDLRFPKVVGRHRYLAFTQALWKGINELIARARDIEPTFERLLGTKEGLELVAKLGGGAFQITATSSAN